jgi:hypothetical protein
MEVRGDEGETVCASCEEREEADADDSARAAEPSATMIIITDKVYRLSKKVSLGLLPLR